MYAHQSLFTTETFPSIGDPYSYLIENVLVGKCTKPILPAVASRLRSHIQMIGSRINVRQMINNIDSVFLLQTARDNQTAKLTHSAHSVMMFTYVC